MIQFHPIANIFPMMTGDEFDALVADIAENGQREPIYTHDNQIIDGRNRYNACLKLGLKPIMREWDGAGSLVSFVVSLNLHRRHLTSSQCAVIALDVLPMLEQEAKKRQGERNDQTSVKDLTDVEPQRASEQAASMFGTNRQYVSDAKRIAAEAPEMVDAIRNGEMSIPEAKRMLAGDTSDNEIQPTHKTRPENIHVSDDSYEWFTPPEYIEAARSVMGSIDTDPASCEAANAVVKATTFYTSSDDGTLQPWSGNVWLNPPYNMPWVERFIDKAISSIESGQVTQAIILTNNSTDTCWFHKLLVRGSVCLTRGRIRFWSADGETLATRQGQAIFYLGPHREKFISEFSGFGAVVEVLS